VKVQPSSQQLFTIGHSTLPVSQFLQLLAQNQIEVVADVRSYPSSQRSPQFQRSQLIQQLNLHVIKYVFLGAELGGRPKELDYYEKDGRVSYARLAQRPMFGNGIARLKKGIAEYRVAILCSEEDPNQCHRSLLIGRVLMSDGIAITHIRADGRLEDQTLPLNPQKGKRQLVLEHIDGESDWKSIRPVLQKNQLPSSSSR
jgi:uncharacterized protein (DUF488 family)